MCGNSKIACIWAPGSGENRDEDLQQKKVQDEHDVTKQDEAQRRQAEALRKKYQLAETTIATFQGKVDDQTSEIAWLRGKIKQIKEAQMLGMDSTADDIESETSRVYQPLSCSTARGAAVLHERDHTFTIDNQTLSVSPIEQSILHELMVRAGQPVPSDRLWAAGIAFRHQMGNRALDEYDRRDIVNGNISRFRRKLGEYGDIIATVRGFGYELKLQNDPTEQT